MSTFEISKNTHFFPLVEFLAEYRTERQLLNGLIDGSVDTILLFDCDTEEMKKPFPRLTIVDELEDSLSVRVGFAVEEGNENLEACLQRRTKSLKSEAESSAEHIDDYDDEDDDWQVFKQLKCAE